MIATYQACIVQPFESFGALPKEKYTPAENFIRPRSARASGKSVAWLGVHGGISADRLLTQRETHRALIFQPCQQLYHLKFLSDWRDPLLDDLTCNKRDIQEIGKNETRVCPIYFFLVSVSCALFLRCTSAYRTVLVIGRLLVNQCAANMHHCKLSSSSRGR